MPSPLEMFLMYLKLFSTIQTYVSINLYICYRDTNFILMQFSVRLEEQLIKKRGLLKSRITAHILEKGETITSRIAGIIKNNFYDDCLKRNSTESQVMKGIIDVYYSVDAIIGLKGKDFTEVKKTIIKNMANNPLLKAKIKATGKQITVYKLLSGGYCDYADCATTYRADQLEFL